MSSSKTHFMKTDGSYRVKMSLKREFPEIMLGNSKEITSKGLDYLIELENNPTLKNIYRLFK